MLSFSPSVGDSQASITTHKFEKEKVKELIARLVIVEEKPFRFVESKSFNELCRYLNPKVEKMSRMTVKRECMKMYEVEKAKLKEVLKSVSRISLTSDLWMASN